MKRLLADERTRPGGMANLAVRHAVEREDEPMIRVLLADARVDASDNHQIALRLAYRQQHRAILELLLADRRVRAGLNPVTVLMAEALDMQKKGISVSVPFNALVCQHFPNLLMVNRRGRLIPVVQLL